MKITEFEKVGINLKPNQMRALCKTWHRDLVTAQPTVENRKIAVPPGPVLETGRNPRT